MKVQKAKIKKGDKRKFGVGFESNGANPTAESEHTYETSYDELQARGYRFILKLQVGWFSNIPNYQDKSAKGSGDLMNLQVQSDTARAEYKWTKWKPCPCDASQTYY